MPKIVNHDQRRRVIAQATVEVITESGLEATKLVDIARIAGVTTGAITHYFSDKDAVLMAALELTYDAMFTRMKRVAVGEDNRFYEVLAQALPMTRKSRKSMSVWLAFWSRALAEPRVAAQQMEFHSRWLAQVKMELIRHCERFSMPVPDDLQDVCEGITAQVNGLIIRGLVDASDWPQARQRKALKTYLTQIGML
ncbi:MAG: TetR/AcrR family bet gene transcriptional repressor [Halieaceae bacterium]|jgi:TetR/AcrR family transcriptional repressor of bet genes